MCQSVINWRSQIIREMESQKANHQTTSTINIDANILYGLAMSHKLTKTSNGKKNPDIEKLDEKVEFGFTLG